MPAFDCFLSRNSFAATTKTVAPGLSCLPPTERLPGTFRKFSPFCGQSLQNTPKCILHNIFVVMDADSHAASLRHRVEWRWVKGHSGDPDNERVDLLSRNAAFAIKQRIALEE